MKAEAGSSQSRRLCSMPGAWGGIDPERATTKRWGHRKGSKGSSEFSGPGYTQTQIPHRSYRRLRKMFLQRGQGRAGESDRGWVLDLANNLSGTAC